MIRLAVVRLVNAVALFALPCIVPSIRVDSFTAALVAALATRTTR